MEFFSELIKELPGRVLRLSELDDVSLKSLDNNVDSNKDGIAVIDDTLPSHSPYLALDPGSLARNLAFPVLVTALTQMPGVKVITLSSGRVDALRSMGFSEIEVVDPVVDVSGLLDAEPHEPTLNHFEKQIDGPVVLAIGDVVPVARLEHLVQGVNVLATYLDPKVHLAIVGKTDVVPKYSWAIDRQIHELNLDRAWMAGDLEDNELATYLQRSDVFVDVGDSLDPTWFFVATAFDLPIITIDRGGIREWCNDDTILLPDSRDPMLLAEAIHEVLGRDSK